MMTERTAKRWVAIGTALAILATAANALAWDDDDDDDGPPQVQNLTPYGTGHWRPLDRYINVPPEAPPLYYDPPRRTYQPIAPVPPPGSTTCTTRTYSGTSTTTCY